MNDQLEMFAAPKPAGKTFDAAKDAARLATQYDDVLAVMRDGQWRTLAQIRTLCPRAHSESAISARLRDFRKAGHVMQGQRVKGVNGLWTYRVIANNGGKDAGTHTNEGSGDHRR